MKTASINYRSIAPSIAADVYADEQGHIEQREAYIHGSAVILFNRWRQDPDKIFEVVAEADDVAANQIGMAISGIMTTMTGSRPLGPALLVAVVERLLMAAAEKQVRKEMGFAA